MKNKEYFYRDDLSTYKPKFLLLCGKCEFKVTKFAHVKNNSYIRRIIIKEVENEKV